MHWRLAVSTHRPRVAIFVSKFDHCLVDLLYRQRNGELACEIASIISNHPDAKRHADFYGIPYHQIPVTKESKQEAEARELALLAENNIDLIVLARYMQVLSGDFIARYPAADHQYSSFIFAGLHRWEAAPAGLRFGSETGRRHGALRDGNSRRRADYRAGRYAHRTRDALEDLVEKGRDLEKVVLSRAVRWHIENRILLYANKTVIFE